MPQGQGYDDTFLAVDTLSEIDPAGNIDQKEETRQEALQDLIADSTVEKSQNEFDYVRNVLFSPFKATSNAILSAFDDNQATQPVAVALDTVKAALNRVDGPNIAADIVERNYPNMGSKGKAAAAMAFEVMSDPTIPFTGGASLGRKIVRKGATTPPGQSIFRQLGDDASKALGKEKELLIRGAEAGNPLDQMTIKKAAMKTALGEDEVALRMDLQRIQPKENSPINYLKINSPEQVTGILKRRIANEEAKKVHPSVYENAEDGVAGLDYLANKLGGTPKDLSPAGAHGVARLLHEIDTRLFSFKIDLAVGRGFSNVRQVEAATLLGVRHEIVGQILANNRLSTFDTAGLASVNAKLFAASNVRGPAGAQPLLVERAGKKIKSEVNIEKLMRATGAFSSPDHIGAFLSGLDQKNLWEKGADATFNMWIQSLLSNPFTHGRNAATNMFMVAKEPIERALVGDTSGAAATAKGFVEGWSDVFATWRHMPKDPGAVSYTDFRGMHEAVARKPRLSQGYLAGLPRYQSSWRYIIQRLGPWSPGSMMGEADAVFKRVAYQQDLRLRATRMAKYLDTTPEFVMNNVALTHELGALKNAQKATFQQPPQSAGAQGFVRMRQDPRLRFVMPFVKTPLNIVRTGIRYSPFGALFKDVQRTIAAGGPEGRLAMAKITVPAGAITAASFYVNPMDITGGGKSYTSQNESPKYSIKVGNSWFKYGHLDPLRWTLGMAADMSEARNRIDWEASDAGSAWMKLVANVTGTYFKALDDNIWFDGIAKLPFKIAKFSQGTTTSMADMKDMLFKEVTRATVKPGIKRFYDQVGGQAVLDVIDKIPVQSVGLLGEPQKYSNFGVLKNTGQHPVYTFFRRSGTEVPRLPRTIAGNELTMEQRAIWRQLRPKPGNNMPTLADALDDLFRHPEFFKMPKQDMTREVRYIINIYTDAAATKMQQHFPELRPEVKR